MLAVPSVMRALGRCVRPPPPTSDTEHAYGKAMPINSNDPDETWHVSTIDGDFRSINNTHTVTANLRITCG